MRACAPWPSLFLLQTALLLRSTLPSLLPKPLQAYQYRLQQAQQLTQGDNTQQKVATMQRSSVSLNGSWPVGHSKHDQLTGPNHRPKLRLNPILPITICRSKGRAGETRTKRCFQRVMRSGTHDVLLRTDHIQLSGKTSLCDRDRIIGAAVPDVTLSHLFQLVPRRVISW